MFVGDELLLETSPIYGYEKLWKSVQDRNFISFRVTACSDANIILSPRHGSVTDKVIMRAYNLEKRHRVA